MKLSIKTFTGALAFVLVLLTMPLGHAVMIGMEHLLGQDKLFYAAFSLGIIGLILLGWGLRVRHDVGGTFLGLFAALFFWTGWVEFGFVYFAQRYHVQPLIEGGKIVTKPEYLLMPSSVAFLVIVLLVYTFRISSRCNFFLWIQRHLLHLPDRIDSVARHSAIVTFMELNVLLWVSYIVLLIAYDKVFLGDTHPVTVGIAIGSLAWSMWLFVRLLRIRQLGYAIRYAIPTVIIFWTFVEILGRWSWFTEIWVHPFDYKVEMMLMLLLFILLIAVSLWLRQRTHARHKDRDHHITPEA